ncbi:response regulator [Microvirga sp. SRT01]|uniref:histidine kinase n=1 Tax=Sphingomonas longa TaxID=2778730 RepID=A0ABS2D4P7_9SPHN|nr:MULTISPECIES: ATP-binding protein [Alphaproteobacteria]MBM6575553.1 response regulator [Sphingomonas sp. BT552]MBR7708601.1 response regulator [Microvirga sp. SRT01]
MYVSEVEREHDDGVTRGGVTRWQTVSLGAMALLAAAVLIALVLTLRGADRERDRALQLQTHSYDVMILARTLSGTIARAEASLGRYVISGDKSQGQIYWDEWLLAGSQIDRLDRLTYDNPGQGPAIEQLRKAYEARGKELSVTALSTSYGRNSQAYARYYQARKAPALNEINHDLNAIIGRERSLLQQRVATATDTVERSSRIAGVLAIFGLLIVLGAVLLGWLSLRAVGERALARADADAAREHADALAEAVARTSAELRQQEAKLRQVQKMEAVGQLTGGIAHDFNNMLAVVIGGIELAQRTVRADPTAAARHLDSAAEGADRAAALTRRLLAFSREEALKPEPIAAAELVEDMTDLLDRTLGDGVTLVTRNDAGDWRVRADRVQLENVIVNLAVNARDAVDGRGTIAIVTGAVSLAAEQVGACAAGDYVTVAVRDNGCGMTAEVADRVFEPFFTTKEAGKGTGLGLSQIFAFVRSQSGEITIDTAPGEGTAVTLYLPRDTTVVTKAPARAAAMPANVDREGYDILVVEDDPRVLAATMGALEELGHRTVSCSDPLAAPELLARNPHVELVISDVLMPRQTGPEMVAGFAQAFPHVAVLFVTGFAGEANAAEFGEHHVLRKPFTLAGLERAIAASMLRSAPPPEQIAAE